MIRENLKGVRQNLTRLMSLGLLVPGPISADFLNDPASQEAITNGAGRAVSDALNWIAYTSAAISREVHPSGSTGSFGITPEQQRGELNDDEVGTQWSNAHRARFLASDGIERILALDAADRDDDNLAQLYLWAGYGSRLLGEQMCQAVYDGGGAEANSDSHLVNAIAYFDQAEALGTGDIAMAAIAGRAAANVALGNWGAAATDAGNVTAGFSYNMPYFDIGDDNQSNTWVATYGQEATTMPAGDPRMSWEVSGENGDAASSCCGVIAFNPQTKHSNDDSPIELSSYEEMQLILAENEIMENNDFAAGMVIINDLRLAAGMGVETATDQASAMTFLKREHAIEQWLEGRRLPALRRWFVNNTPGDLQPLEQVGDGDDQTGSHLRTRDYCFPISEGEQDTNTNISPSDVIKISYP